MANENTKVTFGFVFLIVSIITAVLGGAAYIFGIDRDIDRRVTVLESQSISSEKFYEKMEQQKKEIIEAIDKKFNELKKKK